MRDAASQARYDQGRQAVIDAVRAATTVSITLWHPEGTRHYLLGDDTQPENDPLSFFTQAAVFAVRDIRKCFPAGEAPGDDKIFELIRGGLALVDGSDL